MAKKPKRGHGEGSIRYRKDRNHWSAQISLGGGKRISKSFRTRKEAQRWVRETLMHKDKGFAPNMARIKTGEYLEAWLRNIASSVAPITLSQYTGIVRNHIKLRLGHIKLSELSPQQIGNLLVDKESSGVGARTINLIRCVLHKSLSDAILEGYLIINPVDGTRKRRYSPSEFQPLNDYQARQLVIAAKKDWRMGGGVLIQLALTTGLRQGELLGLKWSDIDWERGKLFVRRQLQRVTGKGLIFRDLKTRNSKRAIDLGPATLEALREVKDLQEPWGYSTWEGWVDHDLIFPNILGKPMDPRKLTRDFKSLLKWAGLPELRFHDLRHTAATLMLLQGVHPKIVSERLGHSDVYITLNLYSHAVPTLQKEAAKVLDELLTPIPIEMPGSGKSPEQIQNTSFNNNQALKE